MKKFVLFILIVLSFVSVSAKDGYYYVIKGSDESVVEMYEVKKELLNHYKEWSKGVENIENVIKDHVNLYENAYYLDRTLFIVLDEGDKKISGELKASYCEENIKVKSLILELLGR